MPRCVRTIQAEDDLLDIWCHIAADSPAAADRLLDSVERASSLLSDNPQLGPARPDLAPKLRYHVVGRYLLLYRIIGDGVEIVRVLHGARHLPDLL